MKFDHSSHCLEWAFQGHPGFVAELQSIKAEENKIENTFSA